MKTAAEISAIFREQAILSGEFRSRVRKGFALRSDDLCAVAPVALRLADLLDESNELTGIKTEEGKRYA